MAAEHTMSIATAAVLESALRAAIEFAVAVFTFAFLSRKLRSGIS
jgi:hypothetical protein